MAYISAKDTKEIRNQLKLSFPNIKFSVRNRDYSSIAISIMSSNLQFGTRIQHQINQYGNAEINPYYLATVSDDSKSVEVLKKIFQIANQGNHDNSDSQSDYFDVGWYVTLEIGKWDTPYIPQ